MPGPSALLTGLFCLMLFGYSRGEYYSAWPDPEYLPLPNPDGESLSWVTYK